MVHDIAVRCTTYQIYSVNKSFKSIKPNIAIEWLTILFRIRDVPAILTKIFRGFPQSLEANAGIMP